MARPKGSTLSEGHKAKLAEGRKLGAAVRAYLEALEAHKPKRGRKRTKDSITKRLAAVRAEITEADPLRRLQLVQEQMDLEEELAGIGADDDLAELEADFVKVAKAYSQNKGISYAAWRQVGVSAEVLRKAGIGRGA